jgi:benzoylformate decarboxylase
VSRLGRDVVLDYLREAGVEFLFGVPGTNEIPLIDGTAERGSGIEYVPCLHENIAMGAAMGYAWASGRPGVVELHVTPGAGHGVGNLYNAYKSHVPLVVLCAQQHSELLLQEPVLSSDLVRTAGQYAKWAYEVRFAGELPLVMQRALKEAMTPPTRPVFLSIPWDFTIAPVDAAPARITRVGRRFVGDRDAVAAAAERLARAKRPVVIAGDAVGAADAWKELQRLAELLGAPVYDEPMSSYMNYPNHLYNWQGELAQDQATQQATFAKHDVAFLCGFNAQAHVFVFDYAKGPLIPPKVAQVFLHDDQWEIGKNGYGEVAVFGDVKATLPALCRAIERHPDRDAEAASGRVGKLRQLHEKRGRAACAFAGALADGPPDRLPTGADVAIALGELQAEMKAPLMLADEAISDQDSFHQFCRYESPNSYFNAQGGALGMSMPACMGMKLAAGAERTVVNTVGDGTALFYPHSWWTTRKFGLPILYVVTNNREYRTLRLGRQAIETVYGKKVLVGDAPYLRLDDPPMSFVDLAAPFGIRGALVSRVDELRERLREGLAAVEAGEPFVVEVLVDPSLDPPAPKPRADALMASRERAGEGLDPRLRHLGAP